MVYHMCTYAQKLASKSVTSISAWLGGWPKVLTFPFSSGSPGCKSVAKRNNFEVPVCTDFEQGGVSGKHVRPSRDSNAGALAQKRNHPL